MNPNRDVNTIVRSKEGPIMAGITIEPFWGRLHQLRLTETGIVNGNYRVYRHPDFGTASIKDPATMTPEQREEFIEKLKTRLGANL